MNKTRSCTLLAFMLILCGVQVSGDVTVTPVLPVRDLKKESAKTQPSKAPATNPSTLPATVATEVESKRKGFIENVNQSLDEARKQFQKMQPGPAKAEQLKKISEQEALVAAMTEANAEELARVFAKLDENATLLHEKETLFATPESAADAVAEQVFARVFGRKSGIESMLWYPATVVSYKRDHTDVNVGEHRPGPDRIVVYTIVLENKEPANGRKAQWEETFSITTRSLKKDDPWSPIFIKAGSKKFGLGGYGPDAPKYKPWYIALKGKKVVAQQ